VLGGAPEAPRPTQVSSLAVVQGIMNIFGGKTLLRGSASGPAVVSNRHTPQDHR